MRKTLCATGKVRHRTKIGACIAADKKVDAGINVYLCGTCGGWHIGRSNDPARMADRIGALLAQHDRKLKKRMEMT